MYQCSNRTFMELKLLRQLTKKSEQTRSNRTFMELKLTKASAIIKATFCSNRTFMELKYYEGKRDSPIWGF